MANDWVATEIDALSRRLTAVEDMVTDINMRLVNLEALFQSLTRPFSSSSPSNPQERRLGVPRTDVERVMEHYGVSRETAEKLIEEVGVRRLLPRRGLAVRVYGITEELTPCPTKCPVCGGEIPEGWNFCPYCMTPVEVK